MTTRAEHLAWCKTRALEYVESGDLKGAQASMASDLTKHPETWCSRHQARKGIEAVLSGKREAVRQWIESFT